MASFRIVREKIVRRTLAQLVKLREVTFVSIGNSVVMSDYKKKYSEQGKVTRRKEKYM